ncbi:hypothetical protein G7046_g3586 [Stylonectria norvegica]|nr:hypothetical protein G7046_g3586 [Stylonectria norvegica]
MTVKIAHDALLPKWEKIAQTKRASREAAIPGEWRLKPGQVLDSQLNVISVPAECGILTTRELEITGTDAVVLVKKLISREYSSHEVTLAFCKRAAIAQQLVNCLSEIFFETALETARSLDAEYAASGIVLGHLHGLPVSLKDCFKIEATDATIGYTALANQPTLKEEESEVTKIMRQSGAVLFCKTNIPLAMMAGEASCTFNAIYGYTSNPYNRDLSSGGSSGGESALLALRGSPLGAGTDLGGSVRIPASFCGLYSLKPSFGRFPTYGLQDGLAGLESVRNAVGPMATSLASVELWSKTVIRSEPWLGSDPDCLYIPWRCRKSDYLGLLLDDGIVKPLPPVTRALLQTKAALEAAGHTVIEFTICHRRGARLILPSDDPLYTDGLKFALYRSAAADLIDSTLAKTGEPWPQGYEMLANMVKEKIPLQIGDNDMVEQLVYTPATVLQLWKAQTKRTQFAKQMMQAWAATVTRNETGREMDALLMPCTPWPASLKHKFSYDNYTSLWNVLDYCATTIPVTHVSPTHDAKPEYQGRSEAEASIWQEYSPESMVGCPVAVQLVGRRLHEEHLLEVTRVCDDALRASV